MVAEGRFARHWRAHGLPVEIADLRRDASGVLVNRFRAVLVEAGARFGDFRVILLTAARDVLAKRLAARGREMPEDIAKRLDRAETPLPEGFSQVHKIDNGDAIDDTVRCLGSASVGECVAMDQVEPEFIEHIGVAPGDKVGFLCGAEPAARHRVSSTSGTGARKASNSVTQDAAMALSWAVSP